MLITEMITITNKTSQIHTSDGLLIIARNKKALEESVQNILSEGSIVGLIVNENFNTYY